jgi:small subunit ribosomal protein S17
MVADLCVSVLKMETNQSSHKRELVGKVISNKMDKTVVVQVERKVLHPKYRKFVKKTAKHHAHDEDNTCQINDEVVIRESRPLSRKKRWVVVDIKKG